MALTYSQKQTNHALDASLYISASERVINGQGMMDVGEWRERFDRANRGRKSEDYRRNCYRYINIMFDYFEHRRLAEYLITAQLLEVYEALVWLTPMTWDRRQEGLFLDALREVRQEMTYRLKGQIPPELSQRYRHEDDPNYDHVHTVDRLAFK